MSFPGRIYFAQGHWHLKDFCNTFLPNINEDQKNSPTIWGQGPGTEPYGKYGAGYYLKKQSYYLRAGPWAIWQIRRWLLY